MTITLVPNSSQVKAIGYDPETLTLRVYFANAPYEYAEVPQETFAAFIAAYSKGSFLGAEIKGKFEYKKLVDEELAQATQDLLDAKSSETVEVSISL